MPPPSAPPAPDGRDPWSVLMALAQDGDRAAYATLLAAITPALRGRCRRVLYDPSEAEDAVQDVLLTLHRMRHTYDPDRPFRPWLAAIVQARIVDRQRRLMRRAGRERPLLDTDVTFAAPSTNHDETTDHARLHRAIAALPAAERQTIRLLKLEELSLQEAASLTGASITALKVASHRALRRLRGLLGPAT